MPRRASPPGRPPSPRRSGAGASGGAETATTRPRVAAAPAASGVRPGSPRTPAAAPSSRSPTESGSRSSTSTSARASISGPGRATSRETAERRRSGRRPDLDLLGAAAHGHRVDVAELAVPLGEQLAGRVGDEQAVTGVLRHSLETRGRVDRVPDGGELEALLGADVAGHHRSAVEADPDPELASHLALPHPRVHRRQPDLEHLL